MAKSLKDYKRKEIRCLVVEEKITKKVFKITGDKNIKEALKKYDKEEVTKIYNPTIEQREKIIHIANGQLENETIDGKKVFIHVVPMLTDIKVNLENSKEVEVLLKVLEDPDEVFSIIDTELADIFKSIVTKWVDNLRVTANMADTIKGISEE